MKNTKFLLVIILTYFFSMPSITNAEILNIAVASNFMPVFKIISSEYSEKTGDKINVLYGSTGHHYLQIVNGAPIDIFFAADTFRPNKLLEQHKAKAVFIYAVGKLAYLYPSYKGKKVDFSQIIKLNSKIISMANPDLAPYGKATKQSLQKLDLWDVILAKRQAVFGANIAQSYNFIATGAVQSGFVSYAHIINGKHKKNNYWLVPVEYYSPIKQGCAVIRSNKKTQEFLHYFNSEEVKNIILQHGYSLGEEQ